MTAITLDAVRKSFGATVAIPRLDLDIADGEFLVLVGPSGCGKSTALRLIGGLEDVTSGTVRFDGTDVTHTRPGDRDIAMVFQDYALYPHLSVRDNVGFPLRMRRTAASVAERA